jgi:hypothetical protein
VKQELEITKRMLEKIIKSMPNVTEVKPGVFKVGEKSIRLVVKRNSVDVEPIGYYYRTPDEVMKEEFELKDAIDSYRYGPRLYYKEKREKNRVKLYCCLESAGIKIEFMPKWNEILNGVNRMIFTEYENAKNGRRNMMPDILISLQKIVRRAERFCKEIEKSKKK